MLLGVVRVTPLKAIKLVTKDVNLQIKLVICSASKAGQGVRGAVGGDVDSVPVAKLSVIVDVIPDQRGSTVRRWGPAQGD